MSKSVARVRRALAGAGLDIEPIEIGNATTAQMAADLVGCDVAQIAKSIMFRDESSGDAILFDYRVVQCAALPIPLRRTDGPDARTAATGLAHAC